MTGPAPVRVSALGTSPSFQLSFDMYANATCGVGREGAAGRRVAVQVTYKQHIRPLDDDAVTVTRQEDGGCVTTLSLRDLPIAGLVTTGLGRDLSPARPSSHIAAIIKTEPEDEFTRTEYGLLAVPEAQRLRRLGPGHETLAVVAAADQAADTIGQPPTKALRQTLEISQSTADGWVGQARGAGLLPPVDGTAQ